jgi:hypothetical protein
MNMRVGRETVKKICLFMEKFRIFIFNKSHMRNIAKNFN